MAKSVFLYPLIIPLFLIYLFFPQSVYASEQFSTAYDIVYEVKLSGKTLVRQDIKLTNLTTAYYASEYNLTLGSGKVTNISAYDNLGRLRFEEKNTNDQTQIHVFFNEKSVGQGKTLNWTLYYESSDIARKIGRIWEINIPRLNPNEKPTSYNVSLTVPEEFGRPSYIYPYSKKPFFWSSPDSSRGISLAFGDWQGLKFDLNYHLKNSKFLPENLSIALPPDSSYQKVIFENIEPKPESVVLDKDGNWLAKYSLLPKQQKDIQVRGFAQIFIKPREDFYNDYKTPIDNLNSQKYWEQTDQIKQIARDLKNPEAIYDYVVKILNYDYKRANEAAVRLGAENALNQPEKAICMEFTDLFIALARTAGIPAREIDGYAYTSNSLLQPLSLTTDILHSWPEYWDKGKNIWVQIDPTWAKTSQLDYFHRFDFNHFTFVVRGQDSTSPYPAGAYKNQNQGKDVTVNFVEELPNQTEAPVFLELSFPKVNIAGFPSRGILTVKNNNKFALHNLRLRLDSSPFLGSPGEITVPQVPPMGETSIKIELLKSKWYSFGLNNLVIDDGFQKRNTSILVIPTIFIVPVLFLILVILWIFSKKV